MIFNETKIAGLYIIELNKIGDERGFFARAYCESEFSDHGLTIPAVQANISFNVQKGTLRGLHFQAAPAMEGKYVRCTRGAIFDVAVDLRTDSPTYLEHVAVNLTAENRKALYIPENFAHGYQTLEDSSEVSYQVTAPYTPECERGLRYDDPKLSIMWPGEITQLSDRDKAWEFL